MGRLFGTDGVRGIANIHPMTPEIALRLGKAAAIVFGSQKKRPEVLIGKDTRLSGYMFESALTAGLTSMGVDVLLVGPMPTPGVAHLTKSFAADIGIVISASHNPAEHNGIKFFGPDGVKLSEKQEQEMENLVLTENLQRDHIRGDLIGRAKRIDDARGRYIEFVKGTINNRSLKGIKLVLDCANGAAYSVAPPIFRELGADVVVLSNKPDGFNINLNSGALHPQQISKAVKELGADCGIALDGDADRATMVDEKGKVLDGDAIVAILGLDLAGQGRLPTKGIVMTDYTNLGVDELFRKKGIRTIRVANGDVNVINRMLKEGHNLGGEQSGHVILGEFASTGDGTLAGLHVLDIMERTGKKLSELSAQLEQYPQVTVNVEVREKIPLERLPKVVKALSEADKILKGNGRQLVRYSGTEMKCRVMVESKDGKIVMSVSKKIADAVRAEVGA
ncbi:MAG: phosphoglucosamine mutase [Nanoarchaeota archaeon]|nr:MAG: phosphoglucosamine mutase [Nanoarchaeota archaeon]